MTHLCRCSTLSNFDDFGDFENLDHDQPEATCATCGDPLCPGCGPSVQTRLLRLLVLPIGIVVVALVTRSIFFGGPDSQPVTSPSLSTSPPVVTPTETTVKVTESIAPESPSSTNIVEVDNGTLSDETIRSVVQIQVSGSRGLCGFGSGTVVGDRLTVLTNFHVIEEKPRCPSSSLAVAIVGSLDERPRVEFRADVMAVDEDADLAILKLTPLNASAPELRPIRISEKVSVGESIFIVGFPAIGGASITATQGVVSGFSNLWGVSWIKTDASVSGGNSGGAAFNLRGELIGVPTMASQSEDGEVVDCRPAADTNGDGSIDDNDACQSVGGFLNLLSPAARAIPLLKSR